MKPDVLAELDRLIANTPPNSHVCAPLRRSMVVDIADEIRRLRNQVAQLVAMGDEPKPKPVRPPKPHNTKEW